MKPNYKKKQYSNDLLATFVSRYNFNAKSKLKKLSINTIKSKKVIQIIKILIKEGYILSYHAHPAYDNIITIRLNPKIKNQRLLKLISKNSSKVYESAYQIQQLSDFKLKLISSSKGIISSSDSKKLNIGGKVLLEI